MCIRDRGKNLQSISLATGVKEWEIELEDFRGNFIRSGNRLLILGESGRLFVVQIDGNGASLVYESAKPLLEPPCYSSIAASDGVFWLRNENEIVAIAFKPADGN